MCDLRLLWCRGAARNKHPEAADRHWYWRSHWHCPTLQTLSTLESDDPFRLMTLVTPLTARKTGEPVDLVVLGQPRAHAKFKDAAWAAYVCNTAEFAMSACNSPASVGVTNRERRSLEVLKPAHMEELLLMTDDGRVVEGSQSNFFAIKVRAT